MFYRIQDSEKTLVSGRSMPDIRQRLLATQK